MANHEKTMSNDKNGRYDMKQPHFVLIPLMAQGHMIPAADLALLLAARGALASLVVTTPSASRVTATIDHAKHSGLPIRLVQLTLPYAEVGLPEGIDNFDTVPAELMFNFFRASAALREPLEHHLRSHQPRPTCIISDFCHPWTMELATSLKVPRLSFFSLCCLYLLSSHNVEKYKAYDGVKDENAPVIVPGLAQNIETTKAQSPGFFKIPGWEKFADDVLQAQLEADGIVMNNFQELEPWYLDEYRKAMGKKIWTVGPVSLYHEQVEPAMSAARGNKSCIDADECTAWLDKKKAGSVVYVSFGSVAQVEPQQVVEIGFGLEASEQPFIWVVKNVELCHADVKEFLHGLEKRIGDGCLIIKGWSPQVVILSHAAVGGFVTHCGWNSTLEAITAGVPVVTWPYFGDQFLNEKLVNEVVRTGVSVGVKVPLMYTVEKNEVVVVRREEVEKAVRCLMDGGEEGMARRKRAKVLGEKAKEAMKKGGSSYENLSDLINHFLGCE